MKRVLKKVTAALLAATMVVGLAACGSGNGGSGNKSSKSGKVKIGVSIWSSTDVLGSQCKKMLDAAAKALDVEVQYVDQGHVSEKVTASVEQLAAAGCQGIIICNSSDTEMTSAIKTCNDNKVYLAQFFRVISQELFHNCVCRLLICHSGKLVHCHIQCRDVLRNVEAAIICKSF